MTDALATLNEVLPGLLPAVAQFRGEVEQQIELDHHIVELVRLGALIAVGGAQSSYDVHVERARQAGVDDRMLWDVVLAVAHIVGMTRVIAAAPLIQRALAQA